MEHIQSYNERYLTDIILNNIKNNIDDICIDLKDQGFEIRHSDRRSVSRTWPFYMEISRVKGFTLKDISDTTDHISNYLDSMGYESKIENLGASRDRSRTSEVAIYYKNK